MTLTAVETSPASSVVLGRRVVVGMDDDLASIAALRFAATEAAYRGGDVLALHVWQYPSSWGFPGTWSMEYSPAAAILADLLERIAELQADRARAGEPLVVITAEVRQGIIDAEISAASHGASLLVLGARHHSWLVGSVSKATTAHPPCPVVVVPAPAVS